MKARGIVALLGVALAALLQGNAMAQETAPSAPARTARIEGLAVDARTGALFREGGVAVRGHRIGSVIDSSGHFGMDVPPGTYTLMVRGLGLIGRVESVKATAGETTRVSLKVSRKAPAKPATQAGKAPDKTPAH